MPGLPDLQQSLSRVLSLPAQQILMAIIAVSGTMALLTNHKISTVSLLLQYVLLPQLLSERLHQSLFLSRLGIGFAICLILYLTADHVQNWPIATESGGASNERAVRGRPGDMGLTFRILTLALGAFVAYRLWRRYPLPPMPPELTLASYWLMITGILLALMSLDPLRIGFGLLSFVNGFVGLYLFWEPGFLVTGLLNVVEILFAMGVVLFAESWLHALTADAEGNG